MLCGCLVLVTTSIIMINQRGTLPNHHAGIDRTGVDPNDFTKLGVPIFKDDFDMEAPSTQVPVAKPTCYEYIKPNNHHLL